MAPGKAVDPDLVKLVFKHYDTNNKNYTKTAGVFDKSNNWVKKLF